MKKGRLSTNLISNSGNFALNVIVGILYTPYLMRNLGVAAYGVIPLAMTVTSIMSVITLVLNAAVGRFLTIALEQGDVGEANKIFNTSLFGSLSLAVILCIPSALLTYHLEWFFNLPSGYESQTKLLLIATFTTFILTLIASPFEVVSYCRNRFDLRNGLLVLNTLIRVGVVVLLFNVFTARIWQVGVGIVTASFFTFIGAILVWRNLTPQLVIQRAQMCTHTLIKLVRTGGWVAISQVGTILLLSIDLLVVNILFGADATGRYAPLMQWSAMLRGIGLTIAGILGPTIIYFYARENISEMVTYTRNAVKFLGLFIALPVGLISGLSRPLLHVWLGPDFVILAPLLSLMTAHLCINMGYLPLHNISIATNNVRWPGIVQIVAGVVNLALALLLAGPLGWGMYGVAAAGAIVLTVRNVVFTPLYGAYIIGRDYSTFLKELLPIVLITATFTAFCWFMSELLDLSSWLKLVSFGLFASAFYVAVVWGVILNGEERKVLLTKIPLARRFA